MARPTSQATWHDWLADKAMTHVRGGADHPQTQGKIERWHQTLKNRILLENYYLARRLEAAVAAFIAHYNHHRYHESLHGNLTPADVYFGRGETILAESETHQALRPSNSGACSISQQAA